MWTPATRRQHNCDHLRYGSDLSDAEWENIAPFMPPPAKGARLGVAPTARDPMAQRARLSFAKLGRHGSCEHLG
jgi:hypothetical protein